MNSILLFDFTVNKENKTIHVLREFDADLETVWAAWTTAEILDQWWGPLPHIVQTKTMDFREGGIWHYAMVSPEGEKCWSRVKYLSIAKERSFTAKDGFCDEHGTMNPSFSQNLWESNFTAHGTTTVVDILFTFDALADLEFTIDMDFEEGFSKGLLQLDEVLANLNNKPA